MILTPSANEESWGTSIGGTVDGATNAAAYDNGFIYDYTVMMVSLLKQHMTHQKVLTYKAQQKLVLHTQVWKV